jgi:hypothetical protein
MLRDNVIAANVQVMINRRYIDVSLLPGEKIHRGAPKASFVVLLGINMPKQRENHNARRNDHEL